MSIIDGIKGVTKGVKRSRAIRKADPIAHLDGKVYCKACGAVAKPTTKTPGSIFIEAVLWLCFLLPGLVYSLWRLNRRHDACQKCGSKEIIPADSPLAMAQVRDAQK